MTAITRTDTSLQFAVRGGQLILDKKAGTAVYHRKFLFMSLKPIEVHLSDIADVAVDVAKDAASGVEMCAVMLITREGKAWAVPAADKTAAESEAAIVRDFIGLQAHA